MRRFFILALAALLCMNIVFGCSWAGRTTGKVVNSVEHGADKFEQSYDKERQQQ